MFVDILNPLQNVHKILDHDSGYFQYYIKVVPTIYESLGGAKTVHTRQPSHAPRLLCHSP